MFVGLETAVTQFRPRYSCARLHVASVLLAAVQFTDIVAIFDLLDIHLVHGWLVDPQVCRCSARNPLKATCCSLACTPATARGYTGTGSIMCLTTRFVGGQDQEAMSAIGRRSYNALTEHLLSLTGTAAPALPTESPLEGAPAAEPSAATGSSHAAGASEADSLGTADAEEGGPEVAPPAAPRTAPALAETDALRLHDGPDEAAELQAALHLSLSREEAASASQDSDLCQENAPVEPTPGANGSAKVTDEAAGSCAGTAEQQSTGQAEAAEDMPDQAVGQEAVQPLEDGYVVVGCGSEERAQLANGLPCERPASMEEATPSMTAPCGVPPSADGLCEAGNQAETVLPVLDWSAVSIPPISHAAQPIAARPALPLVVQGHSDSSAGARAAAEVGTGPAAPQGALPEAGADGRDGGPETALQEAGLKAEPAAESGSAGPAADPGAVAAQLPCLQGVKRSVAEGRAEDGCAVGQGREEGGRERRGADARVIRAWLAGTSSQLTEHGLVCLHQVGF